MQIFVGKYLVNLLVLYPPHPHLAIQKENFIEIFRNVASYNLFYPMSGYHLCAVTLHSLPASSPLLTQRKMIIY